MTASSAFFSAPRGYLAFDLGAESGRAMLAVLTGGRVELTELHRFANVPQLLPSGWHWNLQELWGHLVEGLRRAFVACRERSIELVSLGVDTWGVDYGLLGRSGQLLGLPFCYRDERHAPFMAQVREQVGDEALYQATGLQLMPFNTLFQLKAQQATEPGLLGAADTLLLMPDLLHYFFSGEKKVEATIASTTQMIDPHTGHWARELLEKLGLPHHVLPPIVPAGTRIGQVRQELARFAGGESIAVIVPGSHDTASAIAAAPVDPQAGENWAYLSSGTWSLMGAELREPILTEAARTAPFTHERGVDGTIRFLKNIAGLWLVQEVRRDYEAAGEVYDYPRLTRLAEEADPFRTLLNPDHPPFAELGHMREKIQVFARATGQPVPQTPGQFVRACLETLALCYRDTWDKLVAVLGRDLDRLHIVGGGGRNRLLSQMTADALNRPVIVGPYEGTAMGNALTQAIGAGDLKDLDALRAVVRVSVEVETFKPQNPAAFEAQLPRYRKLIGPRDSSPHK